MRKRGQKKGRGGKGKLAGGRKGHIKYCGSGQPTR